MKPNIETNYGKSGRIDAPRSTHATKRWVKENADFQVWLKEQEGAEFIRKTPMSMLNNYEGKVIPIPASAVSDFIFGCCWKFSSD